MGEGGYEIPLTWKPREKVIDRGTVFLDCFNRLIDLAFVAADVDDLAVDYKACLTCTRCIFVESVGRQCRECSLSKSIEICVP